MEYSLLMVQIIVGDMVQLEVLFRVTAVGDIGLGLNFGCPAAPDWK
jgi:hypothetical protein